MGFFFVRSFFGYQNKKKNKTGSKVSLVLSVWRQVVPPPSSTIVFFDYQIRKKKLSLAWGSASKKKSTDREPYNEMTKASGVDVDFICRLRVAEGKWTSATSRFDPHNRQVRNNTRNHTEQEKNKKQNDNREQLDQFCRVLGRVDIRLQSIPRLRFVINGGTHNVIAAVTFTS